MSESNDELLLERLNEMFAGRVVEVTDSRGDRPYRDRCDSVTSQNGSNRYYANFGNLGFVFEPEIVRESFVEGPLHVQSGVRRKLAIIES